jgi:hypothetical protein
MHLVRQLIAGVLALGVVTVAFGQVNDEPVRLRLALDDNGRLHLSTEPAPGLAPSLYPQPLPALSALDGVRVPTSTGTAIDFTLSSVDGSIVCSPSAVGLARFGSLGGCELLGYGGLPGAIQRGDLAVQFGTHQSYGVGLSYGLDWLDSPLDSGGTSRWINAGSLTGTDASALLPGWVGPVLGTDSLRAERFGLGGFAWFGQDLRIDLNYEQVKGALALISSDPPMTALLPWETAQQDSISLGMSYGRLQGALTGRQLTPESPMAGPGRDSLDLGFSWRMPWNAALEFGARNLLVRPKKAEGSEPSPEDGDLRVPYLRYHQEL